MESDDDLDESFSEESFGELEAVISRVSDISCHDLAVLLLLCFCNFSNFFLYELDSVSLGCLFSTLINTLMFVLPYGNSFFLNAIPF